MIPGSRERTPPGEATRVTADVATAVVDVDGGSSLVDERDGRPVAVLGTDQPRPSTRWRRQRRATVPAAA